MHATTTPSGGNLVSALGEAITAAAAEGDEETAAELAGIVARVVAKRRAPVLAAAGVSILAAEKAKRER